MSSLHSKDDFLWESGRGEVKEGRLWKGKQQIKKLQTLCSLILDTNKIVIGEVVLINYSTHDGFDG